MSPGPRLGDSTWSRYGIPTGISWGVSMVPNCWFNMYSFWILDINFLTFMTIHRIKHNQTKRYLSKQHSKTSFDSVWVILAPTLDSIREQNTKSSWAKLLENHWKNHQIWNCHGNPTRFFFAIPTRDKRRLAAKTVFSELVTAWRWQRDGGLSPAVRVFHRGFFWKLWGNSVF